MMAEYTYNIETTVVGTEDGKYTYEIRKRFDGEGRTAVVIALYPTISLLNPFILDNSTMYLLNHTKELGYNCIRILNLFPNVFRSKPSAKQLRENAENLEYISSVFEEEKEKDTDIIIAWGASLKSNEITNIVRGHIVDMIISKQLEKKLRHFSAGDLDAESTITPHMLWLGLRCKDNWFVESITVKLLAESINKVIEEEKTRKQMAKAKTKVKEAKENMPEENTD